MDKKNSSNCGDKVLNILDDDQGSSLKIKPLTKGLGFKDRVFTKADAIKINHEDTVHSDAGTLDIGHKEFDHGVLNIENNGELRLQTCEAVQPILFHSGHDGLVKKTAKKSNESLFGALIDIFLILAGTILTVAILTEFTKYFFDFEKIIMLNAFEFGKVFVVFGAYFLLYKIFARVFFGKTLGEWSSRNQLGLFTQRFKAGYPIKVLAREVACLITGVFLFPLLSSIFKKDMGYYVSGLQTYVEHKN